MEKRDVIEAFNKHFLELWDDIARLFPDDKELRAARLVLRGLISVAAQTVYKVFKSYVYDKYRVEIMEGNINYFLEKKYDDDLRNMDSNVLLKIDNMRGPIKRMASDDKASVVKYMQNLCRLVEAAEGMETVVGEHSINR